MTRVTTQKARKDYPPQGIKKGEVYYKWSFRFGGSYKSKTNPRPSQLTQGKMSGVLAAMEELEDFEIDGDTETGDISSALSDAASQIAEVAEEYRESGSGMEDGFGHATERSDALQEFADELESFAQDVEGMDIPDKPEDDSVDNPDYDESVMDDWIDEVRSAMSDLDVPEPSF